jgi:hypothetical protein
VSEYRYALEIQESPFPIGLNPSDVHDTSSVYIYRILPVPVTMNVFFQATGLSYVEVFDADGDRFLLPEKTEIIEDTVFTIEWDGKGVFEVRVWKDGNVESITLYFDLPDEQVISEVAPEPLTAQSVLVVGLVSAIAGIATLLGSFGRRKR